MKIRNDIALITLAIVGFLIIKGSSSKKKVKRGKKRYKIPSHIFNSPDDSLSGRCMDNKLLSMLVELQVTTGYPVFSNINSAVRTPYWNKKVGGVSNSAHLKCQAVDIGVPNKTVRNQLVMVAKAIGFTRIGVGNTFVHLDVDSSKSQYVAWGYPSGAKPEVNPFV